MRFNILVAALIISSIAQAQMFTSQEIHDHQDRIEVIVESAADCLESTWNEHLTFFKKHGVSKFYGGRRKDYATPQLRKEALKKYGASISLANELESTSCVGLAAKCLGQGFAAAGLSETWQKINTRLVASDMLGTELQTMLQELGWKVLYWNPDPSQNAAWDQEDRKINPLVPGKKWNSVWGGHAARYDTVVRKGNYYGIQVDDSKTLVGFGTTPPEAFTKLPFFVGTAHAGYHVFPGYRGKVIEAHSMRDLNAIDNMEVSPFNPLAPKGGPRWTRSEKYRSGVIVVPPMN